MIPVPMLGEGPDQHRVDEVQVLIRRAHDLSFRRDLSSAEQRNTERRISIR